MILDRLLNKPSKGAATSERRIHTNRKVAGVYVDDDTALTYSAVYLSVKIISESIAALPFNFFQRVPDSTDRKIVENHPARALLMRPNSEMTGFNFMRTILSHASLRGNGYAWIGRDRSNRAGELILVTPDRVNKTRLRSTGEIVYEVSNGTDANTYYSDDEMLHIAGMGFDGLTGYSVVSLARRSFAMGIASEQFGASFYENGAQLGTVIEVPLEVDLNEAGRDLLLSSFNDKHKGVSQFHRTAVVDQGMKVQTIGIPQKDAQFIESRKFNITDVARWFNMPPHKLKDLDLTTVGNIEEQNINFVQDTLMPWIINLEQTMNWKLLGVNNNRQFMKYNMNALLRGDSKARAEYYKTRFNMGSLNINEIKAYEDENGIGPNGDKYFMQSAMTTIDNIIDPPEPPAPAPVAQPSDENGQQDDDDPADEVTNLQLFRPLIRNAIKKPFLRVQDRIKQAEGLDAVEMTGWLGNHLERRKEHIDSPILDVFKAMTGEEGTTIFFTDALINECRQHFLNNAHGDPEEVIERLADDFIELCGRLLANKKGN